MYALALSLLGMAPAALAADLSDFTTSPVGWVYPPSRGYSASTASVYACGGIDPNGTRTSYPLSDGKLAFESQTLASNVNILYVNETDPTLFHDFSTYTDSILDMSIGEYCTDAPDFAAEGWAAGTNVTMLIIWQFYGNATYYYTCADLTLVDESSYTAPSYTCSNSSVILDVASANDSLVLDGENFENDQAGDDGQTVSITSTPTAAASTAAGSAAGGSATSAASGTATSAATASGSSSSSSGAGRLVSQASAGAAAFGAIGAVLAWATL